MKLWMTVKSQILNIVTGHRGAQGGFKETGNDLNHLFLQFDPSEEDECCKDA